MRIFSIPFLLIIFLTCGNNGDCLDESKILDDAICTEEYQPVCGCDGLTYGNDCQADKAGVTEWTEGECE